MLFSDPVSALNSSTHFNTRKLRLAAKTIPFFAKDVDATICLKNYPFLRFLCTRVRSQSCGEWTPRERFTSRLVPGLVSHVGWPHRRQNFLLYYWAFLIKVETVAELGFELANSRLQVLCSTAGPHDPLPWDFGGRGAGKLTQVAAYPHVQWMFGYLN